MKAVLLLLLAALNTHAGTDNLYKGQIFSVDRNFAVFSWNPGAVRFFALPPGHLIVQKIESGGFERWDPGNFQMRGLALCADAEFDLKANRCKTPIFPEPLKTLESPDSLQVIAAPGFTSKSPRLLISTERYDGPRNTGLNPVQSPFFSVYDLAGAEVFRFPIPKTSSHSVVAALGISTDGKTAAIGIGELIPLENADTTPMMPRKIKKVLLWEAPNKLTTIPSAQRTKEVERVINLGVHESFFSFYKWPDDLVREKIEVMTREFSLALGTNTLRLSAEEVLAKAASDFSFSDFLVKADENAEPFRALAEAGALAELRRIAKLEAEDREYALELALGGYGKVSHLGVLGSQFTEAVERFLRKRPEFADLAREAPNLED